MSMSGIQGGLKGSEIENPAVRMAACLKHIHRMRAPRNKVTVGLRCAWNGDEPENGFKVDVK